MVLNKKVECEPNTDYFQNTSCSIRWINSSHATIQMDTFIKDGIKLTNLDVNLKENSVHL